MAHKCKCVYCKIEFDRDKEPFVEVSNLRYAHKKCAEKNQIQKTEDEQKREELISYIEKLFNLKNINAKISKQIRDFREQHNYTYDGILGTLYYWYEELKSPIDAANGGIGIVPYIYDEAKAYYSKIDTANQLNAGIVNYKMKIKELEIFAPQPEVKAPKLFNLEEDC